MASAEFETLKEMFERLEGKVDTITKSLKSCQSHCYVDNPGKWTRVYRAVSDLFKKT